MLRYTEPLDDDYRLCETKYAADTIAPGEYPDVVVDLPVVLHTEDD